MSAFVLRVEIHLVADRCSSPQRLGARKTYAEGLKIATEAHHLAQACDGRARM
ncbi:hypothetical protein ACE1TF_02040 [Geomicrobium sp. JSM 1781026]|uniref:hypothetical protein n=1 Tax=Geomicrobium sp. JSM 1781026 TaxID=3344580 RepID=UPI0035C07F61